MRRTKPALTIAAIVAALRRAVSRLRWSSARTVWSPRSAPWRSTLRRYASVMANLLAVLAFFFILVLVVTELVDRVGGQSETTDENGPAATALERGPDPSLLPTLTIINSSNEMVPVRVEIADTNTEQERGLKERTELAENAGMLFVFPQEHQPSFFMKDTLIPLSVAFIDTEGYIVDIQDMQPLDLTQHRPPKPAKYALEVNQGFFEERGIQVGNRVDLPEWPYSAGRSSSTEVVQAFREAGLEVGESYPVEQEPGWEELPVPKTYEEATRFEILSIGEDSGGRVFVFESERDLAAVRDYYAGLIKPIRPHLYVEGDVLVEINHRLPEAEAAKYGAVLKVSNIQSRQ